MAVVSANHERARMTIWRDIGIGCCAIGVGAGFAGHMASAISPGVSDCLQYKAPGLCSEHRQEAILPELPDRTSTMSETPQATAATTSTGSSYLYQPRSGAFHLDV